MAEEGTDHSERVVSRRAASAGRGTRRRDPKRSQRAILDAAEQVFAQQGYDGASLAGIGEQAGVSAALPAYFFGDKAQLYEHVTQRLFADRDKALGSLADAALSELDGTRDGVRRGLNCLVSGYLGFLVDRPQFVQLMARDALDYRRIGRAEFPRHSTVFEQGVQRFLARINTPQGPAVDSDQLLVSIVALCFFPLEHDTTMLAGMGYRTRSKGFIDRRTEHVVDLLMRALTPG